MSLNKALEDLKFDNRLLDLNIKMGRLTQEQLEKHLKSIPDVEAQCEKLDLEKTDTSSL